MSTIVMVIELLLPEISALLKVVVKNPTQYSSLKNVFQTALVVAQEVVADLQTILAGM